MAHAATANDHSAIHQRRVSRYDNPAYVRWKRIDARRRYFIRRRAAVVYLGGRCENCDAVADDYTPSGGLQLDHVEAEEKSPRMRRRGPNSSRGFGNLRDVTDAEWWAEVEKCQLRCFDCHIERTLVVRRLATLEDAPF